MQNRLGHSLSIALMLVGTIWAILFCSSARAEEPENVIVPAQPDSDKSWTTIPTSTNGIAAKAYHKVWSLVIGNNHYGDGWANLQFAEADARDVSSSLKSKFGFEVISLIGPQATRLAISNALAKIQSEIAPEDDFIFFFSGHGASPKDDADNYGRRGYLIPAGAKLPPSPTKTQADAETIEAATLVDNIVHWRARHRVLFFDACFAGWAGSKGLARSSLPNQEGNPMAEATVQVLTAGKEGEKAIELEAIKEFGITNVHHGLFTYAILEAISADKSRSVLSVFLQVSEYMNDLGAKKYKGRVSTPMHRMLMKSEGEFFFVPGSMQTFWLTSYTQQAKPEEAASKGVLEPVTEDDYKRVAKQAESGAVVVPEEELKRYETRAAMGDPKAMAIVTEIFGARGTAADKEQAGRWAKETYETGDPWGKLILGRAYEKGYGVNKSTKDAELLKNQSGLLNILNTLATFNKSMSNLNGKYTVRDLPRLMSQGQGIVAIFKNFGALFSSDAPGSPIAVVRSTDKILRATQSSSAAKWPAIKKAIAECEAQVNQMQEGTAGIPNGLKSELTVELKNAKEAAEDNFDGDVKQALVNILNQVKQLAATQ